MKMAESTNSCKYLLEADQVTYSKLVSTQRNT